MITCSRRILENGSCGPFVNSFRPAVRYWIMAVGQDVPLQAGDRGPAQDHARRGCHVTAYDLSPNMLSFAESKARHDGLNLEFISDKKLLTYRKWPLVTCIGVLDYYPDPRPLLRGLDQYLEEDGKLILTWPNALSPLGWFYFIGSRFTVPSTPHTPAFVQKAAGEVGYHVSSLLYAFPSLPFLGFTLVVEMHRRSLQHNSKMKPQ